jgi:hypothetical protein
VILEYLPPDQSSADTPLIRISSGESRDYRDLQRALEALAGGELQSCGFHALPGMEPRAGIEFTGRTARRNGPIVQETSSRFSVALTSAEWDNIASLVEPFTRGSGGFQWLIGANPGSISLLLSAYPGGTW